MQQTLRESNGKLAELAASLRETNADLSRQNIRIADANPRALELYGYDQEELLGMSYLGRLSGFEARPEGLTFKG